MKHINIGRIKHVPPRDEILDSALLVMELLGEDGKPIGEIAFTADSLADDESQQTWRTFSFRVDEAPRKIEYLRRFPLSEGEHNRYRIENEMRADFDDFFFRERRGRERYEGLGDEAIRDWRLQQ